MTEEPRSEEFVNTELAARILGLKTRHGVLWLIHHSDLPAQRIGGRYVLRRAEVEAYARKREEGK